MTMSKMTLLGANYVVGPDGGLIGAAPNASIRSQWERDGLPN